MIKARRTEGPAKRSNSGHAVNEDDQSFDDSTEVQSWTKSHEGTILSNCQGTQSVLDRDVMWHIMHCNKVALCSASVVDSCINNGELCDVPSTTNSVF